MTARDEVNWYLALAWFRRASRIGRDGCVVTIAFEKPLDAEEFAKFVRSASAKSDLASQPQ